MFKEKSHKCQRHNVSRHTSFWICIAGLLNELTHGAALHRSCLVLCEKMNVEIMQSLCVKRAADCDAENWHIIPAQKEGLFSPKWGVWN